MLDAGFHFDVGAADYHADPCEIASLSSSVAAVMIEECPRKAWQQHPRLNPVRDDESDPTRAKEIGTAAHKLILARGRDVVAIDAADFKGGGARQARKEAYAAGLSPILRPDLETANAVTSAFHQQIALIEGCEGFRDARAEVVAICRDETGAMLRIMMDKFEDHGSSAVIWDVKTGDQSAAPQGVGRRIANMGFEVQAAFYERVVLTLRPELAGRLTFRWALIENEEPHLMTVVELDAAGMTMGRKKVAAAIALWNRCVETGFWPGYPARIIRAEYPPYAESSWLAREESDEELRNAGIDPFYARSPWRPADPVKMLTELTP